MKKKVSIWAASLLAFGMVATTHAAQRPYETVYAMSNSSRGNEIAVLTRGAGGQLSLSRRYSTGGVGSGVGTAAPGDPLGSGRAVIVTENGRWLLAANAGSNTVSSFRMVGDRLALSGIVPSGGRYPTSIAQRGNLIYVLNAGGVGTIAGFRIDNRGRLLPIPNSIRILRTNAPDVGPQPDAVRTAAQVQFTPDGRWLVVPIKRFDSPGEIRLYSVDEDGMLASTPVVTPSTEGSPFAFGFDIHGNLLQTELLAGALTAYSIEKDGHLQAISATVVNHQTATCWVESTPDYAYTTNPLSDTISGYRISRDGSLSLLNPTGVSAFLGANHFPLDLKISDRGQFLNVVNAGIGAVQTYRIQDDGQLSLLNEVPLFPGFSGMAGLATN